MVVITTAIPIGPLILVHDLAASRARPASREDLPNESLAAMYWVAIKFSPGLNRRDKARSKAPTR